MTLLRLQREPSDSGATLGALYVNDIWQCWTLEDVIREVPMAGIRIEPAAWVASWKVAGRTAIPAGRYALVLTRSERFSRMAGHDVILPELVAVPGFTGIRIHALNRSDETEGCLGVGAGRSTAAIGQSRDALAALMAKLTAAAKTGERFEIEIFNPPARHITQLPISTGTAAV